MLATLLLLALLAAIALTGWALAELDLRDTRRVLEETEYDLDIARGWLETQVVEDAVVHPTLHMIEGGES